jgi:hypothetical protein
VAVTKSFRCVLLNHFACSRPDIPIAYLKGVKITIADVRGSAAMGAQ